MAYEEVEKLFQIDARGIWNRKVTAMWNAPFYVDRPVKNEFYQTLLGIHAVLEGRDLLNVVGKIFGEVEPGLLFLTKVDLVLCICFCFQIDIL